MSDNKKYYDENGNEISPAAAAKPRPQAYYDVNGSPIQLNPRGFGRFGAELDAPQTQSDVEGTVAPYVGRLAVKAPPIIGSYYGPGGTMIGTGVSQLLKAGFPKIFGQPADNIVTEGGKDLLLNNVLPAGIEGVVGTGVRAGSNISKLGVGQGLAATAAELPILRNLPGVRQGAAKQITSQIMDQLGVKPESQILGEASDVADAKLAGQKGNIQNLNRANPPQMVTNPLTGQQSLQFHPAVQQAMKDLEDTFGKNTVGKKLLELNKEIQAGKDVAGNQTYKDISNMALSDIRHVQNWKLAAGEPAIQELAFNKLLTGQGETLDASKMLEELTGPKAEIYKEAISPAAYNDFKNMVNEIHAQQSGHSISDALVHYSKGRLLWMGSALAGGGIHGSLALPGVAAGGITITNSMLTKAMANPDTAQIVVQALRTPASSPQARVIGQALSSIWKSGAAAVGAAAEQ